jgi:tripeptide aminopeptidase
MDASMNEYSNPELLQVETCAVQRFLKYVTIETTANDNALKSPSSDGQRILGSLLVDELKSIGLPDASLDGNGYVMATLPGAEGRTIGLVAHMDTSTAFSGRNVQPVVHHNYSGEPIVLKNEITLSPQTDPELPRCVGHTLITTDGTTLLGADDKAGIAIIMGVLEYLHRHPEVPHPTIRVCFTPDEEIGRGTDHFPIDEFDADFAITVDGTFAGELNFETFEAYSIDVAFTGVSVHPGHAKGSMVNALRYMGEFLHRLPVNKSPETTEKREGFIHPVTVSGDAASCRAHLIIRDFTESGVQALCQMVESIVADIMQMEPRLKVKTVTQFNYPNMIKYVEPHEDLVTNLKTAVKKAGISPSPVPIRGGTDGANLCRKGLVTPNLFTGAVNLHGPREWVSVTNMGYSFCAIMNLLGMYVSRNAASSSPRSSDE